MPRDPEEDEGEDLDFGEPAVDPAVERVDDDATPDLVILDAPTDDAPLPAVPDDDATPDLDNLHTEDGPIESLVVVDWSTEVVLVELGLAVRAILDPTRATSTWYTDRSEVPVTLFVAIGAVRGEVSIAHEASPDERIVLGRDFLAGRIAVRSG